MYPADEEKPAAGKSRGLLSKALVILLLPPVLMLAMVADCLGITWAEG